MVREAFQATTLFGKLPFELICEVSYRVTSRCDVRSLSDRDFPAAQIFSYLDLSDLIQVAHTSSFFAAMLLAPSAKSIWSRSRRNAGYALFPGMSKVRFAVTMEGSLRQASFLRYHCFLTPSSHHLITDCIQYCGAPGNLEMPWMARLCKDCMKQR